MSMKGGTRACLWAWLAVLLLGSCLGAVHHNKADRCEAITIPICREIAYNQTIVPNLMGHASQEEATSEVYQYFPLIKVNCSVDIQLFLCAMYAPVCTILETPIPPCRSLCESARKCETLMKQFGFPWPAQFNCSRFPAMSTPEQLCMGQTNRTTFEQSSLERLRTTTVVPGRPSEYDSLMDFKCPKPFHVASKYEYKLNFGQGSSVKDCGAPCHKLFFLSADIELIRTIVGIAAIVSFLSCLFTLATFSVDMARFPYPEKPIIYLTFSYFIVSIVLLFGFASGDSISCNAPFAVDAERLLKQGALHDWRCSVLGMLFYFFLMAGALWWFMLAVTWFLSAGLQWGQEAIDVKAAYLHGIVWTLASIQTTAVLILKKIEGDILTGTCFVGILDETGSLLVFVPLAIYMTLGFMFLLMGLISLVRIRSVMKRDGTKTDKLEKLIGRIGLFSLLYLIPAGCMLACFIYEYLNISNWMSWWQEQSCRNEVLGAAWQIPCRYPDNQVPNIDRPQRGLFLLKYLSIVMMGIFSGTWVWSGKTIITWKMFYRRMCGLQADGAVPTGLHQAHL